MPRRAAPEESSDLESPVFDGVLPSAFCNASQMPNVKAITPTIIITTTFKVRVQIIGDLSRVVSRKFGKEPSACEPARSKCGLSLLPRSGTLMNVAHSIVTDATQMFGARVYPALKDRAKVIRPLRGDKRWQSTELANDFENLLTSRLDHNRIIAQTAEPRRSTVNRDESYLVLDWEAKLHLYRLR